MKITKSIVLGFVRQQFCHIKYFTSLVSQGISAQEKIILD